MDSLHTILSNHTFLSNAVVDFTVIRYFFKKLYSLQNLYRYTIISVFLYLYTNYIDNTIIHNKTIRIV